MSNQLCKILNIKYPIIQGALTNVSDVNLVSSVSNAGGLGVYAPGVEDINIDFVREQIKEIKKRTSNSFGVNIMMASPYADKIVKLVCEEKVPVVTTGAGSPAKYIDKLKEAGIIVAPVVSTKELAIKMENIGVDIIIAEGMESGGYIGGTTSIVLIPQVVSAVKIPVVAAGGFVDGKGLVVAMVMGAQGIQMGTRFLTVEECRLPSWFKDELIKADAKDAIVLGETIGSTSRLRVLNTLTVKCIKNAESDPKTTLDSFQSMIIDARSKKNSEDLEKTLIGLGQCIGLVHDKPSVKELIERIMIEYELLSKPDLSK